MAEKNHKTTPFEQEMIETAKLILEYKLPAEANIVAILYKKPDELYNTNLNLSEFTNNVWRVYFQIAHDIVLVEKKNVLDEITVGLYLEKHLKLKAKYEEYGAWDTISAATSYVNIENLEGYITELRKWNTLAKLLRRGFPIKDRLSDFADMTSEEIYNEFEAFLNDTFVNIDSDVKSYDICSGIHELIEKLDAGSAIGLPYADMPILTKETGGQYMGSITLLGGISNAGKSTVARSTTLPSIIKMNEKVVIMVNEDSLAKWQREMLIWVCNNILKFDIQKHVIRDGNYSEEVKAKLYEAADWLTEKTKDHMITVIPFLQYQTSKAIKEIKKYSAMGVKYFILDTFKMDAGKVSANSWMEMQQSMVAIKDTIKAEALNVHILITFQLEKGSSTMRHYTQNNIGMAKNIVDVASTCIMIRDIYEDEYTDEKRALNVYRLEGANGKTKIPVKLDKSKRYQVFFIVKNQEGAANAYQIVAEHDKSRNIIHEVGITNISPDF
mgnify:CR=1 FL=1